MAIITDIERIRGRVIVRADGMEIARPQARYFDLCPLNAGDDIAPEAWIDRLAAAQLSDAYEAALTSLDYCARSERELKNALRRKGFVDPAVDAAVERLRDAGLVDDARYARRMAELQASKPVGVFALRRKLAARGISDADADAALAGFDDEQQRNACHAAAEGLWRKYQALPRREARAKLSSALARRGFGWDAIEAAVDGLLDE